MKIQDIFHVLFSKLCDGVHKSDILSLLPINVKEKDEYKVEKIFDSKNYYSKLQYVVKLINYLNLENQ